MQGCGHVRAFVTHPAEWDHLAHRAVEDLPRKCKPLIGRFANSGLRQYSVGPKQRVWYAVSGREVTIRAVHRTHPKATD